MPASPLVLAFSRALSTLIAKCRADAVTGSNRLHPKRTALPRLRVSALCVVLSAFLTMFGTMAYAIDTTTPTVTSVTAPSDATYGTGQDLTFTVLWSEPVVAVGTPFMYLSLGSGTSFVLSYPTPVANYVSGSGTDTWIFQYTVESGITDDDGIVLGSALFNSSGGSMADLSGNNAGRYPALSGVPAMSSVLIDAVAPTVTSVSVPSDATYGIAQALGFTVNLSKDVTVTGTPRLALTMGTSTVYADYDAGSSSSNALVFKYTTQSGDLDADGIALGSSIDLNGGTITDGAGNSVTADLNSVSATTGVLVDAVAPTVTSVSVPSDGTYVEGQDIYFTVNFSKVVTVARVPRLLLTAEYETFRADYVSGSGSTALVFKRTLLSDDIWQSGFVVSSIQLLDGGSGRKTRIYDAAGNDANTTLNSVGSVTGVLVGPYVTSLSVPSAGTYAEGQDLTFTVKFSTAAYVTGTPYLQLDIGAGTSFATETAQATYVSGSGTDTWVFAYTVASGQTDDDGIAVNYDIQNSSGGAIKTLGDFDFSSYIASVPSTSAVLVQSVRPTVTSVSVPSDDTYEAGEDLSFTVNWSAAVTVTGTPRLTLTIGGSTVYADYASGSDSTALVFTYAVQAGDADTDGVALDSSVDLNGGTIKDGSGNTATLTLNSVGSTASVWVGDMTAPTVSGVNPVTADGTYGTDDQITFDVAFTEDVIVTGTPQITLETGATDRVASYTSGSGSQILRFTYTVLAGDTSADLDYISTAALALNSGTIKDGAGNGATLTLPALGSGSLASNAALVIDAGVAASPATEFADKADVIQQTLTSDAARGLTSALSANQTMMQAAKGRFVAGAGPDAPLNVDGSLTANPVSLSTMGSFFGQTTQGNGTRQLVFGTFDVQRDDTTGASTATFSGKVAWERSISDTTLPGYFIGGDLAHSNIAGSFTGDQDHLGITAGAYGVHELAKQLYLDGFVSVGAGRNNLTMADDVLALDSDYTTRSATFGGSLSGVIAQKGYEIWPELALSVGRTWIGAVDFTGTAYGTTDDTLSLDAGMVTLANITFRPEFRVPLDGLTSAQSLRLITLAPRLICQQITTTTTAQTCGSGVDLH